MRLGTLVPHFGRHCSRDRIVRLAQKAESAGVRGFWARDHLIWRPHDSEGQDLTFLDPFLTLAAVAAVTSRSLVGTSVAIPVRWPLKLAQEFASLSLLNPTGVIAGIGLGRNPDEFRAAGLDAGERDAIFRDTVEILRLAWERDTVDFHGEIFDLTGIRLEPKPGKHIPIVYGGNTPAAIRRAATYAEGWNGGSMPMATLKKRLGYLEELTGPRYGELQLLTQPLVVIAATRREAERIIPVAAVAAGSEGSRFYDRPPSGKFETIDDLHGQVICGTPRDVAEGIAEFRELGLTELIMDFRLQYDRYEEILDLLGGEVFPLLDGIDR